MRDDFGIDGVRGLRVAMTHAHADKLKLPSKLEAKENSSNYAKFVKRHGRTDCYELEAVAPEVLQGWLDEAIRSVIDVEAYNHEVDEEAAEAAQIAARRAAALLAARNLPRFARQDFDVAFADADILGGDVAPAQALDATPEGAQERLALVVLGIAQDDRLAAAERESRHRVLEAHAARQAQHVFERGVLRSVWPHAATARRRAQGRAVDGDDGLEAALLIVEERNALVAPEGVGAKHHVESPQSSTGSAADKVFHSSRNIVAKLAPNRRFLSILLCNKPSYGNIILRI